MELITSESFITLKDVVDTVNFGRGVKPKESGYLQHGQAMERILELAETEGFGGVEKKKRHLFRWFKNSI